MHREGHARATQRAGGSVKRAARSVIGVTLLLAACPPNRLTAQDTARVHPPAVIPALPDTLHLVRPMGAFWRSLAIPGWGQAATGRHTTGAVFVAWEGITAMMTLKAQQEANYMKEIGSPNLKLKRQEVQDWLVVWGFNHLFFLAGADESAHPPEFPSALMI